MCRSIDGLVKDYEKAGGDCSLRRDRSPFGHAAEVVDCGDDTSSVYSDQRSMLTGCAQTLTLRGDLVKDRR